MNNTFFRYGDTFMKFGFTQIKTPKIVLASATAIAIFSVATPAYADQNANNNAHSDVDISSIIQDAMSNLSQDAGVTNAGTANVSSGGGTANLSVDTVFALNQEAAALGGDTMVTANAGAVGGNSTANGAGITQMVGSGTGTGAGATANGGSSTGTSGGAGSVNGASADVGSVGASCGDVGDSDCLPSASGGGAAAGTGDSNALSTAMSGGGDGKAIGGDGKAIGGGNSAMNLTKSEGGDAAAMGGHAQANGAGQAEATNVAKVNAPVIAKAETKSGDAMGIGNQSYTDIAQSIRLKFNW